MSSVSHIYLEASQESNLCGVVGVARQPVYGAMQVVHASSDGHPCKAAHWQKPNIVTELQVADLHTVTRHTCIPFSDRRTYTVRQLM